MLDGHPQTVGKRPGGTEIASEPTVSRRLAMLVALALAIALTMGSAPSLSRSSPAFTDEVLFSLPVGELIGYVGVGPEQLTWGPVGIAAGADDTIWIADGAGHRIFAFDRAGAVIQVVDVEDAVVGIGGIALYADKLVVLDIAAQTPAILIIEQETAEVVETVPLPRSAQLEQGLSGVTVLADGTVAAELEGGTRLVAVARLTGTLVPVELTGSVTSAYDTLAGEVRIEAGSAVAASDRSTVRIGDAEVSLTADNLAGTTTVAGATDDAVYFTFDEVTQRPDGRLLVDTTVRAYDPAGDFLGAARVPLADMAARPRQPVAVSPADEVVALVPGDMTIDVVRLALTNDLTPVLPAFDPPTPSAGDGVAAASCVNRGTMSSTDLAYRNNSKYLSSTNINGACSGRTKPRYLGNAGTYSSVPYKWGGFSSVAQFNNNMSPSTGRAGDINTSSVQGCAYGVDCSGFVSRVWQRPTKFSTWTLPNISSTTSVNLMLANDIFNLAGSHVILFKSNSGNGYNVSEATTSSSFDRVVYRWISTSHVSSYTPRRYHNVCCIPSVEVCPV